MLDPQDLKDLREIVNDEVSGAEKRLKGFIKDEIEASEKRVLTEVGSLVNDEILPQLNQKADKSELKKIRSHLGLV